MDLSKKTSLSKWFFFFSIIIMLAFIVFGIESGEGTQPSEDSNPILDTIFILSSPIVLPILYYQLYQRVNKWTVFLFSPFLGIAMEWLLFKPADVLNESTPMEATLFFAGVWSAILITPYLVTKFAERSKKNLVISIIFVSGFLGIAILNLVLH